MIQSQDVVGAPFVSRDTRFPASIKAFLYRCAFSATTLRSEPEKFLMQTLNKKITKYAALIFFGALLSTLNVAWAESDMQLQEKALKARESSRHESMDHSAHTDSADTTGGFRGVFYGYLPCKEKDCDGLKMTLSLKPKNNYLVVTQYAKESSREFYEKGKYNWDDKTRILSLTPNKDAAKRQFAIQDDSTLIQLSSDGRPMPGDQEDYTLRRSDKAKSREVHIH